MADKTGRIAKMAISLLSLILLFSTTALPKTIYVDDPANFDNIQAAIDDSSHGDIIIVSPGTYTGYGNRDIDYNGKAITVRSEDPNDPNIVAATIINCNGTEDQPHRGFFFHTGEEANSVLDGLTITNGYADYGGGIYCEGSRPTITNCNIVGNKALLNWLSSGGGGISCRFCFLKGPSLPGKAFDPYPSDGATGTSPTRSLIWAAGFLAESHDVYFGTSSPPPFIGNQTSTTFDPGTMEPYTTYYWRVDELNMLGKTIVDQWSFTTGPEPPPPPPFPPSPPPLGALEEQSSPQVLQETILLGPTIKNCIFIDNGAYEGGGMYTQNSKPILSNCTFGDNNADDGGGGMFTDRSNPALLNCTFIENSASEGGGIYITDSNTTLTNCIFNENSADFGGGVLNSYDSNTTLTDCIFNDNSALLLGGGISNDVNSRTNLTNCTFKGNSTYFQSMFFEGGGGIYNYHGISNLIDCKFIGNSSYRGGGMLNLSHTDMSLTGCVFIENSADSTGGGLYNANPNTILTDCIFSNNSAGRGGGMYNLADSASLNRCMFNGNSAVLGGGMYNGLYSSATMTNCLFSGNSAEDQYSGPLIIFPPVYGYGGGIYDGYGGTKVINCSFNENRASGEGGAIWLKYPVPPPTPPFPIPGGVTSSDTMTEIPAIMDVNDSNVSLISNCIIWGNQDSDGTGELSQIRIDPNEIPVVINFSCIQGWSGNLEGTGNIDADPCFVQLGFWRVIWRYRVPEYVWYEGHFQLLPESLCINAGDPNFIDELNDTDLDNRPRVVDGRIDMGAYEYQGPGHERKIFVDDDAVGANNGSSWFDAFNYLQDALAVAQYGDTILVAQGTYKPDQGHLVIQGDREATFRLKNGVAIIGGYAGANAPDPNARNIGLYETILSGDLDGNDIEVLDPCDLWREPTRMENALSVVICSMANSTTVLDGFTITAAHLSGMYNRYSSVTVNNCTFTSNVTRSAAYWFGAGMCNINSSPTVTNCNFLFNSAKYEGGGMYNGASNPLLTNCVFIENSARYYGGGMYNDASSPLLINCIFIENASGAEGGGIKNSWSNPSLSNCQLIGNVASRSGGGIQNFLSTLMLTNCTLSDNWAGSFGGGICNERSNANLTNCILWGNTNPEGQGQVAQIYGSYHPVINYCCIEGWTGDLGGSGNIGADPCFVEPGCWDVNGVWIEGDYHLLLGSPCIDTGDPDYIAGPNETDLDGKPRVIGGRIDMGAYEYGTAIPAEARILPRTINLASKGKWITCYIWLPEEYNVADIGRDSVLFNAVIRSQSVQIDEDQQVAIARFDREDVQTILDIGEVELTITGRLNNGTIFEATHIIRVIDRGSQTAK